MELKREKHPGRQQILPNPQLNTYQREGLEWRPNHQTGLSLRLALKRNICYRLVGPSPDEITRRRELNVPNNPASLSLPSNPASLVTSIK
ncbi:17356_t:CDS:2, partial [Gigaspora rosea]